MKQNENNNGSANAELLNALNALVENISGAGRVRLSEDASELEEINLAAAQINQISALFEELRRQLPAESQAAAQPAGDPWSVDLKALQIKLRHLTRQAGRVRQDDRRQVSGFLRELSGSFRELSGLFQREERADEQPHAAVRILDNLHMITAVLDSRDRLLFANRAAVDFAHAAGGSEAGPLLTSMIAGHRPPLGASAVFYESRDRRWYQIESAPIEWPAETDAVMYTLTDVTEIKSNEEVLRAAAEKDALTGVYRRETGLSVFREVMRGRGVDAVFTVSFLDIDGLKAINDRHGHTAGDAAIRGTADILRGSLRDSDIILRAGGDEFIFILIGGDEHTAHEITRRIHHNLDRFNRTQGLPFVLRFSIGMSETASGPADIDRLIRAADARMYENKRK